MYIVYCQNKPKSEHIVSEYIDTFFEVRLTELQSSSELLVTADSQKFVSHKIKQSSGN